MNDKITFVVFTYNEERRIEYVLRCFRNYGRILIMDNGSTDKTAEIAKAYGAEVQVHNSHGTFAEDERVANNVLSKISTPWVYWGYCDELLPKPLLEKLIEISNQDEYKAVLIPKRNLTYGMEDFVMLRRNADRRFFRKDSISFKDNRIHQTGRFLGKDNEILRLPAKKEYSIFHCSTYTVGKYINTINSYSTIEADFLFNKGDTVSLKGILFDPLLLFLRVFLYEGNWKFGYGGFIMSMQFAVLQFLTQSKLWENCNDVTLESIEKKYDTIKEKILAGIER